jgi:hypothetical protein
MKHESRLPLNETVLRSETLGLCLNIITNTDFSIFINIYTHIIFPLTGGLESTDKVKLSLCSTY